MNSIPNESSSKMAFIGTKQEGFCKLYYIELKKDGGGLIHKSTLQKFLIQKPNYLIWDERARRVENFVKELGPLSATLKSYG